ncbi:MAG: hypothetical protein H6744_04595 [Deltaproteobacteria bacterium]|nr:hypothetical protein [Deltaproteobacteria bacterium]MCB9785954.1 hypothetical protein [Deltaproteobacteria bacterium]
MQAQRPALLIVAHGSRAEGWLDRVREFAGHVAESPGIDAAFSTVDVACLEAVPPSIPDAVRALLASGVSRVLVAPLFLTASTHLSEDIPGLLGLPLPEHVRRRLTAEGHQPLPPGLPVTLLDLGPIERMLGANVERRLSLRSEDPSEEAVVLCAYGSTVHHERWEALMAAVRAYLMRHGYAYACHAYVGHVVSHSPAPTLQAIRKALHMAGVRRVHVVPVLLSTGAIQTTVIAAAWRAAEASEGHGRVLYEPDAILPDGDLAAHVAAVALRELGVFVAADRGANA